MTVISLFVFRWSKGSRGRPLYLNKLLKTALKNTTTRFDYGGLILTTVGLSKVSEVHNTKMLDLIHLIISVLLI